MDICSSSSSSRRRRGWRRRGRCSVVPQPPARCVVILVIDIAVILRLGRCLRAGQQKGSEAQQPGSVAEPNGEKGLDSGSRSNAVDGKRDAQVEEEHVQGDVREGVREPVGWKIRAVRDERA